MKLYISRTSPYARKVLVLAHEVNLVDQLETVVTNPFDQEPALVGANPLSKVPALVVSDELSLFDSRVICEFLDTLHDEARMYPPSGQARWRVLRHQALAEGVMDAAVGFRLEALRPDGQRSQTTTDRYLSTIRRALAALDSKLADLHAEPTIAHVALGVALSYLDLRVRAEPWRDASSALARWFEAWAERPSMVATAFPEG